MSPTYKFLITYNTRVELDFHRFCVIRRTPTNELVGWVGNKGITACVPNSRGENPLILRGREVFQEDMLNTPKTARSENSELRFSCSWYFN